MFDAILGNGSINTNQFSIYGFRPTSGNNHYNDTLIARSGTIAFIPRANGSTSDSVVTVVNGVFKKVSQASIGGGGGGGTTLTPTSVKTTNYTAAVGDFVPMNTTSGALVLTLPTTPADKSQIAVKMVVQSGTNTVTINTGGSDVFNKTGGGTALTLKLLNQGVWLQYNASGGIWYVLSDDLPLGGLDTRYQLSAQQIFDETPTGTINSSNTSFTIAHSAISGTLRLYRNGQRQNVGTDYTYSGTAITYKYAPTTGDWLTSDYNY